MAVHREYGALIYIGCDFCVDEFFPEWEKESDAVDLVSLDIATEQAKSFGWEKHGPFFYCPKCAETRGKLDAA
jgi:hypothetical protein